MEVKAIICGFTLEMTHFEGLRELNTYYVFFRRNNKRYGMKNRCLGFCRYCF